MQAFDWNKYLRQRDNYFYLIKILHKCLSNAGPEASPRDRMEIFDVLLPITNEYISFLDEQLPQAKLYYTELHKMALMQTNTSRQKLSSFSFDSTLEGKRSFCLILFVDLIVWWLVVVLDSFLIEEKVLKTISEYNNILDALEKDSVDLEKAREDANDIAIRLRILSGTF
jgi:hypothetical protein